MSRSSAAAIPYYVAVIGLDDWLAMGLQSLLKSNFHSCSFRVTSNLLSKTVRVATSVTSGGNPFYWLTMWMMKKFCLNPFLLLSIQLQTMALCQNTCGIVLLLGHKLSHSSIILSCSHFVGFYHISPHPSVTQCWQIQLL